MCSTSLEEHQDPADGNRVNTGVLMVETDEPERVFFYPRESIPTVVQHKTSAAADF